MQYRIILSFILTFLFINNLFAQKPTLIFYCGITMVKPITEMAKIIEKKHNCIIKISQGGSKDLYDSIKYSKKGDLYLPGSQSYRTNNLKDGLLGDFVEIGFNKAAIFVKKGNPLKVSSLNDFSSEEYASVLCDPESGSVGKMTKNIFINFKDIHFYEEVLDNTVEIGTDSRNLNKALIDNRADISINWRATSFWEENKKYIDIIEIDDKYAPKKRLIISLLKFSKNKEIAKDFMNFAISKEGQEIMKKYGFLR
ncbi:substrate-binding domain-containing protein [Arcobacter arenosus]|uniref:substrate-binding domain-containing protein n=1 Tax=Arcobacter arenosus TaxID=2576037 RepID=UPI003BA931F6